MAFDQSLTFNQRQIHFGVQVLIELGTKLEWSGIRQTPLLVLLQARAHSAVREGPSIPLRPQLAQRGHTKAVELGAHATETPAEELRRLAVTSLLLGVGQPPTNFERASRASPSALLPNALRHGALVP